MAQQRKIDVVRLAKVAGRLRAHADHLASAEIRARMAKSVSVLTGAHRITVDAVSNPTTAHAIRLDLAGIAITIGELERLLNAMGDTVAEAIEELEELGELGSENASSAGDGSERQH